MVQAWNNTDGLYLKYGADKATAQIGGEYRNNGALREIEVRLDLSTLGSSSAIISDAIFFPIGVRIEEVEVVTHSASTGTTTASLNLGLTRTDRTTAIDADGLIAAMLIGSMDAAGEKTVLRVGSTYAGALIGTTTATYVGYLAADYDTAAFASGVVDIRIRYYTQ